MAENVNKGIPIPDVIDPPESMSMTLCIPKNKDHMAAFFGALYSLTEWNSWQQNGTTDGKELAAVWWRYFLSWDRNMSDLECEDGMGKCCTDPAITRRINPTTGLPEQSSDGGITWTPMSGGLQSYIVEPVPPVTSGISATKCDAATNVSGQVDVWINQVIVDFDTATSLLEFGVAVLEAILIAVVTILSAGTLTAAEALVLPTIAAALYAAWGAGKAIFEAYWTTDIKNKIFCAAFNNIGEDGSFTDAQFSAFWNSVNSQLPASPAKMLFMGFLSSVGRQGLNAMAAAGFAADSDCSDCDTSCGSEFSIATGNLIGRGSGYIDVEAVLVSGLYTANINTPDNATCCHWDGHEVISGTITDANQIWRECGSNDNSAGPLFGDHCLWLVYFDSTVPFSIRFKFLPC